jgi:anthranilate phosphoribosyltransferase
MKALIGRVAGGQVLSLGEAREAFEIMMSGDATPAQVGGFLMALRVRGETVDELTGGAQALRARMVKVAAPAEAIDTCGTGGDASGTFNVSTAAALVVAACGVPVAKHGNRALSSKAGSADVLAALGVNIDADPPRIERAIRDAGIGFMMAPATTARCATSPAQGSSSAPARFSTCSGRSPTRPAPAASSSACLPATGSSRSPTCLASSAPSAPGWCTAPTAWTS